MKGPENEKLGIAVNEENSAIETNHKRSEDMMPFRQSAVPDFGRG